MNGTVHTSTLVRAEDKGDYVRLLTTPEPIQPIEATYLPGVQTMVCDLSNGWKLHLSRKDACELTQAMAQALKAGSELAEPISDPREVVA